MPNCYSEEDDRKRHALLFCMWVSYCIILQDITVQTCQAEILLSTCVIELVRKKICR